MRSNWLMDLIARWPLVFRSTMDSVRTENFLLRTALRDANAELRRHRILVASIKDHETREVTLARIDGRIH